MNHEEQLLQQALGKPKYYLDTTGQKEGERYFWFPTAGDSMTDGTERSIPGRSLVLGRLLQIRSVQDMPINQLIVIIINDGGQKCCMLKTVCDIKTGEEGDSFCLRSYSPRYNDYWYPFSCFAFMFLVEKVRRPGGSEYTI
jgi:hypothetical protein